jgi:hypothetical protein
VGVPVLSSSDQQIMGFLQGAGAGGDDTAGAMRIFITEMSLT